MQARLMNLYFTLQTMMRQEEGQDLIEYALVVALIALAATAGMNTVATDINLAFSSIGSKLTNYTS
jgi:pilus assembly protein Flp/PilA